MATKRPGAETNVHSDNDFAPDAKKTKDDRPSGTLLFSGATDWDSITSKTAILAKSPNTIWKPVRLQSLENVKIVTVSSSSCSVHILAVSDVGHVYAWGRNDKGQLGLGDTKERKCPTLIKELTGYKIVSVATGKGHSLFLSDEGKVLACGDNRSGQTVGGNNTFENLTPKLIKYQGPDVSKIACGNEFSMIVDKTGSVWSWGHPEYGQLGHNTDGATLETGKRQTIWSYLYSPKKIMVWIEKDNKTRAIEPVTGVVIKEITCGKNHTVVIDEKYRAFSWGFGGYGRLGHSQTGDEQVPRLIKFLDGPRRGIKQVVAGGQFNLALSEIPGTCYMWGQYNTSKEANMYPKPITDLSGWQIRSIACSSKGWMVAADDSVIGCVPSPGYGELASGDMKKSSAPPVEIKTLGQVHVLECGMGIAHSIFIARNESEEDEKAISTYGILDQSELDQD